MRTQIDISLDTATNEVCDKCTEIAQKYNIDDDALYAEFLAKIIYTLGLSLNNHLFASRKSKVK